MTCETALELISPWLDGELTSEEEARLQAHLEQCPHCRAIQAELAGLHQAAPAALDAQVPPELSESVLKNLPAQTPRRQTVYWKRWGAMAAVVAVVALAAWRLPRFLFQREVSADTAPAVQMAEDANDEAAPQDGLYSGEETAEAAEDVVVEGAVEYTAGAAKTQAADEPETPALSAADGGTADASSEGGQNDKAAFTAAEEPVAPHARFEDRTAASDSGSGASTPAAPPEELTGQSADADVDVPVSAPTPAPASGGGGSGSLQVRGASLPGGDAQWLGVLTLEEYTPGENAVEVVMGDQRQYILPAHDFLALVRGLEEQGAQYTLRQEGEDISADAESGLVLLAGE